MTADVGRIAELVTKIHSQWDLITRIHADIAYAKRYNHGRGCADDRVGLYYAECALEEALLDLGDELFDEAASMYPWRAA